jgi:hypothetical protein
MRRFAYERSSDVSGAVRSAAFGALVIVEALPMALLAAYVAFSNATPLPVFLMFFISPLVAVLFACWAWPGIALTEAFLATFPGFVVLALGGRVWANYLGNSFCVTNYAGRHFLTDTQIGAIYVVSVLAYAATAGALCRRRDRAWWGFPLAIVVGYTATLALAAVLEGGPHPCSE